MELNCEKCLLRAWHPNDVESLVRHANNRKVWLSMRDGFPHPYTQSDALDWIARARAARPVTSFAIVVANQPVGGIGFELRSDIERFSAEVGYWLGEEFWGRGIATDALKAATAYALQTYKLNRIYALPFSENTASIRVLQKCGYRREGILRLSAYKNGQFLDQALYAFIANRRPE